MGHHTDMDGERLGWISRKAIHHYQTDFFTRGTDQDFVCSFHEYHCKIDTRSYESGYPRYTK